LRAELGMTDEQAKKSLRGTVDQFDSGDRAKDRKREGAARPAQASATGPLSRIALQNCATARSPRWHALAARRIEGDEEQPVGSTRARTSAPC